MAAEQVRMDALFVRVVESVYATRASAGATRLDRDLIAEWLPVATPERFELVFHLADWHDTHVSLLEQTPARLLTERVLFTAGRNNAWPVLARRRLLPRDFAVTHGLLMFEPNSHLLGAERFAERLDLLLGAGCDVPDDVRFRLVDRMGSYTMADLRSIDQRSVCIVATRALGQIKTLTPNDLLTLATPLLDIGHYNASPRTRGQYTDPGPALEALLRHGAAHEMLIPYLRKIVAKLPVDVLRSMASVETLRRDPAVRARLLATNDPGTFVRLVTDATATEFSRMWPIALRQSPEHAMQLIEARPDLAAAVLTPEALAPLLDSEDRAIRTRALARLGTLAAARTECVRA